MAADRGDEHAARMLRYTGGAEGAARPPACLKTPSSILAERWPVGMLFVRCKGGVSHHPAESVMAEDVALAIEAFGRAVRTLADGGAR